MEKTFLVITVYNGTLVSRTVVQKEGETKIDTYKRGCKMIENEFGVPPTGREVMFVATSSGEMPYHIHLPTVF